MGRSTKGSRSFVPTVDQVVRPNVGNLRQNVMGEVKAGLSQGKLHFFLAGRVAFQVHQAPEDGGAAVHMHASRHPLDDELGIQAGH